VNKLHGPPYSRDEVQPVYRPLVTADRQQQPSPSTGDAVDDVIVAAEQVPGLSVPPPTPEIIGDFYSFYF